MTTPHRTLREAAQMALDALLIGYHRGTHDAITALREALAADHLRDGAEKVAPAAPVPDGWVMVPREPTPEMLAVVRNGPMHETWTEGYCAMIAASPAAPVPLTDEQIDKILERERMKWATSPPTYEFAASFARAIEAAHGITGGKP